MAGGGADQRGEPLAPGGRGLVGLDGGEGGGEVGMRRRRPGRGQRLDAPCAWHRCRRGPAPPAPPRESASARGGWPAARPRCRARCCRRPAPPGHRPARAPRRASCRRRAAAGGRASRRSGSPGPRPSPPASTGARRGCAASARCRAAARSAFLASAIAVSVSPSSSFGGISPCTATAGCGRRAAWPCRLERPGPVAAQLGRLRGQKAGDVGAVQQRLGASAPSSSRAWRRPRRSATMPSRQRVEAAPFAAAREVAADRGLVAEQEAAARRGSRSASAAAVPAARARRGR